MKRTHRDFGLHFDENLRTEFREPPSVLQVLGVSFLNFTMSNSWGEKRIAVTHGCGFCSRTLVGASALPQRKRFWSAQRVYIEATEPTLTAAPWREMLAKEDAILADLKYQFSVNHAITFCDAVQTKSKHVAVNSHDNSQSEEFPNQIPMQITFFRRTPTGSLTKGRRGKDN